jgi:hypothetical protein
MKKKSAKKKTAKKKTATKKKTAAKKETATTKKKGMPRKKLPPMPAGKVRLLSGGNPQIAKGDGDAPVQAYIASMPGWQSDLGKRIDALVVRAVPQVKKAVKWNSPFYGVDGQGYFLSFHVFAKYLKLTWFRGTSLQPMPPGESKVPGTRYLDIRENDVVDEAQLTSWVKQAASMTGWQP